MTRILVYDFRYSCNWIDEWFSGREPHKIVVCSSLGVDKLSFIDDDDDYLVNRQLPFSLLSTSLIES